MELRQFTTIPTIRIRKWMTDKLWRSDKCETETAPKQKTRYSISILYYIYIYYLHLWNLFGYTKKSE